MADILQDVAAPALVTAIEANLHEFFREFRKWPRAELCDTPELLWSITDIAFPVFNSIHRACIAPERTDALIEAAIARGRARNVPMLWWTGPGTRPVELGTRLKAHGFAHDADLPGMAVDVQHCTLAPPPPGLRIEVVNDAATLRSWCDVLAAGFGMPEFAGRAFFELFTSLGFETPSLRNYLGRLDGEAVASSTLYLGAGVAGIYDVATIGSARKQGIGAAMTAMCLRDAQALGYRAGILHASAMGAAVYRQLGFREYCRIGHYSWSGAHASSP